MANDLYPVYHDCRNYCGAFAGATLVPELSDSNDNTGGTGGSNGGGVTGGGVTTPSSNPAVSSSPSSTARRLLHVVAPSSSSSSLPLTLPSTSRRLLQTSKLTGWTHPSFFHVYVTCG